MDFEFARRIGSRDHTGEEIEMALRELAERSGGGIVVRLFWNDAAPPGSDVSVEYHDESRGVSYILYPPRDRVLDAFHHPNAYTGTTALLSAAV